jgi:hypothetical protein
MIAIYQCAVCGETNEVVVDESQGEEQVYIEDCQVCCRPNVLRVTVGEEEASIDATFEE